MHNFQNENLTYPQKSKVEELCRKYGIDFFGNKYFLNKFFPFFDTK